jgi:uncharacterized membrane protein YcaP (DUF421 family)
MPAAASIAEIAVRTATVYVLLLVGVRLAGKRQIAQLTPFDLVVLLLLSNAVQNAMTGPDTSVAGGATAAGTLLVVNGLVTAVRTRHDNFRRWVEGVPVSLIIAGEVQWQALRHEHLTIEELMAALREHDVIDCAHVELATLEIDGTVSVIRRDAQDPMKVHKTRHKMIRHARRPNN